MLYNLHTHTFVWSLLLQVFLHRGKVGVGADIHFSKVLRTQHTHHYRNHAWWPSNHQMMATEAIQHNRWRLPLPTLLLRPSILPRSQRNSLRDSMKMGRWQVWAALLHKMCSGGGPMKQLAPDLSESTWRTINWPSIDLTMEQTTVF
jgi:hypothetical protein